MAFQIGEIKITATINGLSFYNSQFGCLVRTKGGPTPKQFKRSPAFARARENSNEFSLCSRFASSIRQLIIRHTGIKDKTLYHRLIKLMRLLANADQFSTKGQRHPLKGIHTAQGKFHLKYFMVTTELSLYNILIASHYIKQTSLIKKRKRKPFVYRIHSYTQKTRYPTRADLCSVRNTTTGINKRLTATKYFVYLRYENTRQNSFRHPCECSQGQSRTF